MNSTFSDWEYPEPEMCHCGNLVRDHWRQRPCLEEQIMATGLELKIRQISDLRLTMWPESSEFNMVQVDHNFGTLLEEAGEFRSAIRSFIGRPFSPEKKASREHMIEELGDTLVPIIALSHMTGIPFDEALQAAKRKLFMRKNNFDNDLRIKRIMEKDAQ